MDLLKLAALDAQDLDVLSAHLQDAVLTVGDLSYLSGEQRFIATLNRFVWEKGTDGPQNTGERRRAALHFDRVTGVRSSHIRRNAPEAVLSLLAIRFTATEDPSGTVDLVFSGGGTVRLDVECIEAQLSDLGPAWQSRATPRHDPPDEDPA